MASTDSNSRRCVSTQTDGRPVVWRMLVAARRSTIGGEERLAGHGVGAPKSGAQAHVQPKFQWACVAALPGEHVRAECAREESDNHQCPD
jgi:hypothetical protein